jgi:hypothetical protein
MALKIFQLKPEDIYDSLRTFFAKIYEVRKKNAKCMYSGKESWGLFQLRLWFEVYKQVVSLFCKLTKY